MPPFVTVSKATGKLKVLASQMSPVQSSLIRPAASMWMLHTHRVGKQSTHSCYFPTLRPCVR